MYASDQQYNQNITINFQAEDTLTDSIDKITNKVGGLQLKLGLTNLTTETFGKNLIKNNITLEKFNSTIKITDKLLQKTINSLGLFKVGTILAKGIGDAQLALSGLNEGIKAMNATGFDSSIIDKFTQLTSAITGSKEALDNFTLTALSQFNQYNKSIAEVAVLFEKTDPYITNLSKNIQNLVNNDLKNAVTSIQALGASYQAASALFTDSAENIQVMTAGLKLAKAGGADTGATMKVLTQTLRAYNLAASDSNKVAVVLNKAMQLGITTIPELTNGFAQAAVTANAAKVKLEELGAAVAALTLQGFDTPGALTGLEALFRNIINKTPQAEAALRELRDEAGKPIKFDINEIRTKGFAQALDDLNKAAKGNAEVLATIIPEATAYNTALALMANNAQQLKNNSDAMFAVTKTGEIARKALDDVFGIKINNQAEKFEQIVNRITETFIQFGEALAPVFDEGVKAVQNFTNIITSIPDSTKRLIVQALQAQLILNKVNDVIGILIGTVIKATTAYLGWRVGMLFMNGQLGKQVELIAQLIKTKAGLIPVIKQIIGIDQSYLFINKELNNVQANRIDIIGKIIKREGSLIANLKVLIGLDKAYVLGKQETVKATTAEAIAQGKLLEIQTLFGKRAVANNALNRALFQNVKQEGDNVFKKFIDGFKNAIPLITGGLTKISGFLLGIGSKLLAFGATLTAYLPPLALIAAAFALVYDQVWGTSAQLRKMHEELKTIGEEQDKNTIKTLEQLDAQKKLTYQDKLRLINLQKEVEVGEEYRGIGAEIAESFSNLTNAVITSADAFFTKWLPGYTLLKQGVEFLGKTFNWIVKNVKGAIDTIRYDQMIGTFNEINKAVERTDQSILEVVKSSQKLKSGLSGFSDIDKLIKSGELLGQDNIQKIKNSIEVRNKQIDSDVAANSKRLEVLDKQLEKYNDLSDIEKQNASEGDKRLASERDKLAARTDILKQEKTQNEQNLKDAEEYWKQRNLLIQRVRDNSLYFDPNDKKNTTTKEDVAEAANAIQVRLRKSLRLSQDDLEDYSRKVAAAMTGATEYVNKAGDTVKIKAADMTQFLQQFDSSAQSVFDNINAEYENGYITGSEAAKKLLKQLESNVAGTNKKFKELLDPQVMIASYSQVLKYSKEGSKEIIDLLNNEAEIVQANQQAGVIGAEKAAQETRKIQREVIKEQIKNLEQVLRLNENIAPAQRKQYEEQLKLLRSQYSAAVKEDQRKSVEEKFKIEQSGVSKQLALLNLQKEQAIKNQDEIITKTTELRKKQELLRVQELEKQLQLVGKDKNKRIQIETEILNAKTEYERLFTEETEREYNKRGSLLQNETNRARLAYQKINNTLSNTDQQIQTELKLIEARNKATIALNDVEVGRLQNQLKVTADLQTRADLEYKSVELKSKNQAITFKQEKESLIYQQKSLDLSFQRQQIEINIKKLENQSSRKLLELELEKALKYKIREEEIEAIKLKLEQNKEEGRSIEASNNLLQKTRQNQKEINENAIIELNTRQAIAREGGLIDQQLAKQNKILATYEKQAQRARIEAQLIEISGNKKLLQSELITKQYDIQTQILQKQAELQQSQQDDIQRRFALAKDLAATDYQKQQIEKLAAKQALLTLKNRQQIEKDILEMNIKQNRIALERSKIENKVDKIKLAAEVKVQEAETAKILADKTRTDEEKQAAQASLEAKKFELAAKSYEDQFIKQQEDLLNYDEKLQRHNLFRKQQNDVQDAEIAYAKSMFGRGAQNNIYRAIKNSLNSIIQDIEPIRINDSEDRYNRVFALPRPPQLPTLSNNANTPSVQTPQINYPSANTVNNAANNIVPSPTTKTPVVINFTNTNEITVNGDNADKAAKDIATLTTRKLYDIIRNTNVELGK